VIVRHEPGSVIKPVRDKKILRYPGYRQKLLPNPRPVAAGLTNRDLSCPQRLWIVVGSDTKRYDLPDSF
jgi:hypothetical protein